MLSLVLVLSILYGVDSEMCSNNDGGPNINVDVSQSTDFTLSGGAYLFTPTNTLRSDSTAEPHGVSTAVANECITSNDPIESITFKYRYFYGYTSGNIAGGTMELRLVSQSDANNYYTIYSSPVLDGYGYTNTCPTDLSCFSPVITYIADNLSSDISIANANYEFQLLFTNNQNNVHLDLDSLSLVVDFAVCVTTDICDVEVRVDDYEDRLESVETKVDNVISHLQGTTGAHSVAGDFIKIGNQNGNKNLGGYEIRIVDVILMGINLITFSISLLVCWKVGIFSNKQVVNYKYTQAEYVESECEPKY